MGLWLDLKKVRHSQKRSHFQVCIEYLHTAKIRIQSLTNVNNEPKELLKKIRGIKGYRYLKSACPGLKKLIPKTHNYKT